MPEIVAYFQLLTLTRQQQFRSDGILDNAPGEYILNKLNTINISINYLPLKY